jgi:hypothetical protein
MEDFPPTKTITPFKKLKIILTNYNSIKIKIINDIIINIDINNKYIQNSFSL